MSTPKCAASSDQCQLTSLPCSGTYASGLCPGASDIKCCQSGGGGGGSCAASTLFSVGGTPVKQLSGDTAFFYTSSLDVDADGAPNAYDQNNTGIDYLANAGSPGNWYGIATDNSGTPYVQGIYPAGSYAPYKGFYVSTTSLENSAFSVWDVRRYANAVNLTFFVLPGLSAVRSTGVKLGDLAYIYWSTKSIGVYAIYADVGPAASIGEASVKTHVSLGSNPYNSRGKVTIGIDSGVTTLVFPGSGSGKLLTQSEINSVGSSAFNAWGGMSRFKSCILN